MLETDRANAKLKSFRYVNENSKAERKKDKNHCLGLFYLAIQKCGKTYVLGGLQFFEVGIRMQTGKG